MKAGRDEDVWSQQMVARFLNRSFSWFEKMEFQQDFRYPNGEIITAHRNQKRFRRWTLDDILAIAESCLRRGRFTQEEFDLVKRRVDAFRDPPKRKILTVLNEVRYDKEDD